MLCPISAEPPTSKNQSQNYLNSPDGYQAKRKLYLFHVVIMSYGEAIACASDDSDDQSLRCLHIKVPFLMWWSRCWLTISSRSHVAQMIKAKHFP